MSPRNAATVHHTLVTFDANHRHIRDAILDAHLLHRLVMTGYPLTDATDQARHTLGVLFTAAPNPAPNTIQLLVQAHIAANWAHHPAHLSTRQWTVTLPEAGQHPFQLRAAPARNATGGRPRQPLNDPAAQAAWLHNAAARSGFTVDEVNLRQAGRVDSEIKSKPANQRLTRGHRLTIPTVEYTGMLTVTDPTLFHDTIRAGIGPAKAYGCGLLLTR